MLQTCLCLTLPSRTNWARILAVKNGKANQFSRVLVGLCSQRSVAAAVNTMHSRRQHICPCFIFVCVCVFDVVIVVDCRFKTVPSSLFWKSFSRLLFYEPQCCSGECVPCNSGLCCRIRVLRVRACFFSLVRQCESSFKLAVLNHLSQLIARLVKNIPCLHRIHRDSWVPCTLSQRLASASLNHPALFFLSKQKVTKTDFWNCAVTTGCQGPFFLTQISLTLSADYLPLVTLLHCLFCLIVFCKWNLPLLPVEILPHPSRNVLIYMKCHSKSNK